MAGRGIGEFLLAQSGKIADRQLLVKCYDIKMVNLHAANQKKKL